MRPAAWLLLLAAPAFTQGDDVFRVDLPVVPPDRFEVLVEHEGVPELLRLERTSVRAEGFQLLAWRADGTLEVVTPPPPATYRGVLDGDPGSVVVASLSPAGLSAHARPSLGAAWEVLPLAGRVVGAPRAAHLSRDTQPIDLACEGLIAPGTATVAPPRTPTIPGPPNAPDCVHEAELAYDADYEYFLRQGATVAGTLANIEGHTAVVNEFYARDVQIQHRITTVIVRTAPFYNSNGGGDLLDLFRAEWNTNQAGVPRDMAHLMTDKDDLSGYAGLAYVGVVCSLPWAYGWSVDSSGVVGHELGHNWGAGHCHDLEPCNHMCGACLFVGPNTRDIIIAFRDALGCLDTVGPYAEPLAPYVYPDGVTVSKDDLAAGPLTLDVLANDDDGNCEPFWIGAFDATTPAGASVDLSAAQELVYQAAQPHVGPDPFTYTARDVAGMQAVGQVVVDAPARDLEALWPLDDAGGAVARDASPYGHAGAVEGGPTWVTDGPYGGGLILDGVDDQVRVPALGLRGDAVTISAWVRRDGDQADWSGLVMSRDAATDGGLHLGQTNDLRYTWSGDSGTTTWSSGLVLPEGQWVFVALVVRPHKAVLHLHDGFTHQKKTHDHAHAAQPFDGETFLGADPLDASRRFAGGLADVRVYDRAMGVNDVALLATVGGATDAPGPRDGGQRVDGELSWLASPVATGYDVYFGDDYLAVRDATVQSPEYQGAQSTLGWDPGVLAVGPTWFWRVDQFVGPTQTVGEVWQFTAPAGHRWTLDELAGDVAVDDLGNKDGTYKGGVLLAQPGATAATGLAVRLDGVDDRVRIPKLNLHDNHLTITGWFRRDGDQDLFAGLVFCRDGSTAAGLTLGLANELHYLWDGTGYGWDPGFVLPDQQWTFVALVVDPNSAAMYIGDTAGDLQSASWTPGFGHAPEEFDGVTLIGRDSIDDTRWFQGWVDDVRVYRAALGPDQIAALYASSL